MAGRQPALLEGGGGKAWEPNEVPDRIDVGLLGLVVTIDRHPAAVVGLQSNCFKI